MPGEAPIHFELYRSLKNAIETGAPYQGISFGDVAPEYGVNGGRADVVVFDNRRKALLVIEAKRESARGINRDLDPYAPKVVEQAFRYAARVGADYFATYNGKVCVLYRTFESGTPLLQRKSKSYRVRDVPTFARELLEELARLDSGIATWDPRENAFLQRLKEFHSWIVERHIQALETKLKADTRFKANFEYWLGEQGKDLGSANAKDIAAWRRNFADQGSYLLMNKVIFYKLLESEETYSIRKLPTKREGFGPKLKACFRWLIENVDFEAVFEHDAIFDEIPIENIEEDLLEFINEIDQYDLTQFDSDVIGRIYEGIIPPQERHDMGEYYTPPEICELIAKLTIKAIDDQVLDPGCGSGGFAVAAYHRLKEMKLANSRPTDHNVILGQINAIDINRFPAHLTAINLTIRDLADRTSKVNVEIADFFDVKPGQQRWMKRSATITGEKKETELHIPTVVDVIVANPPYIRQEYIKDKKKVRAHLRPLGLEKVIGARSDEYCYFFTHAHEFLREGGRLGFITSDRWLDVGYGEGLQRFFLDNYKVLAIVIFDKKTFEVPLIGSAITILEKCKDKAKREGTVVKFLRLKGEQPLQEVLDLLPTESEPELFVEDDKYRLVTKLQRNLQGEWKWNRFLQAPPIYFELLQNERLVPLQVLADVSFGTKSGENKFFFFHGKQEVEAHGLAPYVRRLAKAIGQTEYIEFRQSDTDWYVLDLHPLVVQYSKTGSGGKQKANLANFLKRKLKEDGHEDLLAYLKLGEEKGVHEKPTCAARNPWFDLGDLKTAPILGSLFYWDSYRMLLNVDSLAVDHYLTCIDPKEDIPVKLLAALLNSSVAQLFMEMHGRIAKGEAMDRVQMTIYETGEVRVPNIPTLTEEQKARILEALDGLLGAERTSDQVAVRRAKRRLDIAVLEILGLADRVDELDQALKEILERRVTGGAQRTTLMVTKPGTIRMKLKRGGWVGKVSLDDFKVPPVGSGQ